MLINLSHLSIAKFWVDKSVPPSLCWFCVAVKDGSVGVGVTAAVPPGVNSPVVDSPAGGATGAQDLQLPRHGAGPV